MLAVHFGAGNIGRGFIGQLLHESGYKICFVDVNQEIIDDINSLKKYQIEFVGDNPKRIEINNIYAINSNDESAVINEIVNADIVTTALGPNILKFIAPVIAKGIIARIKISDKPLNIIACENMIGASAKLRELVYQHLDLTKQEKIKQQIGFPNAAVDRIVPIQHNNEKLLVKTESFYEWDVDKTQIIGDKPKIKGITYVDNLPAYIERKLFAVNATHAAIAYLGNLEGKKTIYEASRDKKVMKIVHELTEETGELLVNKYNFDIKKHMDYVNMIISRFSSPYISDDITRVGRSPIRKIGFNERLIAPARQLVELNLPVDGLVKVIAAALHFINEKDSESLELQNSIRENGVHATIIKYCGLSNGSILVKKIEQAYNTIK